MLTNEEYPATCKALPVLFDAFPFYIQIHLTYGQPSEVQKTDTKPIIHCVVWT